MVSDVGVRVAVLSAARDFELAPFALAKECSIGSVIEQLKTEEDKSMGYNS